MFAMAQAAGMAHHNANGTAPQGNVVMCKLVEGGEYIYTANHPAACSGHRYRMMRFVVDLPSYQRKVLVEAIDGPDVGTAFVLSEAAFAAKFKQAPEPTPESLGVRDIMPQREAGYYVGKGSGV